MFSSITNGANHCFYLALLCSSYSLAPGYAHKAAHRKWTLDQLRQTDGIIPLQSGTNQFASQRGMTGENCEYFIQNSFCI